MKFIYPYWIALKRLAFAAASIVFVVAAVQFPYDVDAPLSEEKAAALRKYYTEAYKLPIGADSATSAYQNEYIRVAQIAAKAYRIKEQVTAFVEYFKLRDKPVLEIGSGRGYLQDVANDYTGLDIAASVAHFYHKKFVLGSATAMPFPDNSFDGVWSIWVFEHVPNPEQAFREARRVTRDGGVLFLYPAWNCTPWAAEGYQVRPYSDFGLMGKLIKASIPLRSSAAYVIAGLIPIRLVRHLVGFWFGPTRLRYRRLTPNYEKYWMTDSDAINSIDRHEALLWFLSRGDECLNCQGAPIFIPPISAPWIIRVNKSASAKDGI